ncbi:MAG: antitoxin of toxin-antitoxin stability system [Betaproteobacteria bacterium]|nr:antitoxin of toxin-antitoxin stability system [Betaproteobacteria bacterium]
MKLDSELRDTFMAEAATDDRPAAQVIRELMRGYIEQRRQAREYDEYLRSKVERARAQRDAGLHFSNEEVKARAAARCEAMLRRANEGES